MKIAINTTSAVAGGGVTYIKNLLTYLAKLNTTHQYLILTTISGRETFYFPHPRFTFLSFKLPSMGFISRLCWEQIFLPGFLKRRHIDVLFSPANVCPLFTNLSKVVMIQNIEPFSNAPVSKRQGLLPGIRLKLLRRLTILSIKKSQMTIFPSTKAREDIEKSGIFIKHAEVVYHGIDKEIFHPYRGGDQVSQFKEKYSLDAFILCVSNIQRYKNFFELIKAFVLLRYRIDNAMQLVFAGTCFDRNYYNEMKVFLTEHGYDNRVIFLGNIPYEELPCLYAACTLFVYPSTCESFGMTLVEAMACGAPILASQLEPMPEICADAAIYFDPMNPIAIADVISKTLEDPESISTLSRKGLERAKAFSWENTATRTLNIFESIT